MAHKEPSHLDLTVCYVCQNLPGTRSSIILPQHSMRLFIYGTLEKHNLQNISLEMTSAAANFWLLLT